MKNGAELRRVGRPPGPGVDVAVRRERLLDAAERGIRRLGASASMEELAAEAGLTKPALYKHFGDRRGLATALGQRFAVTIMERITPDPQGPSDPGGVLRGACEAFTRFIDEDPEVYRFLIQDALASPGRPQLLVELGGRIAAQLGALLRSMGADPAPAEAWAFALMGSAFSAAEWWIDTRSVSRAQLVDWITDLTWNGLGGVATTKKRPRRAGG